MSNSQNAIVDTTILPFPTHFIAYALGALLAGFSMKVAAGFFAIAMISLFIGKIGAHAAIRAEEVEHE